MNTSLSWIKAYVPGLDVTAQEYTDAMTLTGTKVETFEKLEKMQTLGRKLGSESHIIPVIIGGNAETEAICRRLFDAGYFTLPIRPPTVPEGTSRLRLSLTTDIEDDDLKNLTTLLSQYLTA